MDADNDNVLRSLSPEQADSRDKANLLVRIAAKRSELWFFIADSKSGPVERLLATLQRVEILTDPFIRQTSIDDAVIVFLQKASRFNFIEVDYRWISYSYSKSYLLVSKTIGDMDLEQLREIDARVPLWNVLSLDRAPSVQAIVYTSGNIADGTILEDALHEFAAEHGMMSLQSAVPEVGSWFRRVRLSVLAMMGSERAQVLLLEMQDAVLAHLQQRATENQSSKANSAKTLIEAVQQQEEAIVLIDRLLIVKVGPRLVVTDISVETADFLRRNSDLAKDPKAVLKMLRHKDVAFDETAALELPESRQLPGTI